jgi:hypothetical protein
MGNKPVKKKKCRICGDMFRPFSTTSVVCSTKCAFELTYQNREKEFKRETKRLKEKIKTKREWADDAQRAVNRFIRARDYSEPCISCGTTRRDIQYCAGHYLTRGGHPELRFSEDNIHKQCNKRCNLELSGNIAAYRINLEKKIGADRLATLEGPHDAKHYTIDDLKEIKAAYNARALELEKLQNN